MSNYIATQLNISIMMQRFYLEMNEKNFSRLQFILIIEMLWNEKHFRYNEVVSWPVKLSKLLLKNKFVFPIRCMICSGHWSAVLSYFPSERELFVPGSYNEAGEWCKLWPQKPHKRDCKLGGMQPARHACYASCIPDKCFIME